MNFGELSVLPWTSSSVYCQFNRSRTSSTESPVNNIYWIVNSIVNEPYWIVSSALKELHWFVSQMVREWARLNCQFSPERAHWFVSQMVRERALLNCQFSPEKAPLICESNGSWMMSIQSFVNELYCIAVSVIREWAFLNCYFKRSRTNSTELSL